MRQPRRHPCVGQRAAHAACPVHCFRPTSGAVPSPPFRPSVRLSAPTLPSADSSPRLREVSTARSQFPWPATSRGTGEASRGKRSYRRGIGAGCITHRVVVDGGLCGGVPARPNGTTPRLRCVSLAPHLRATLPSDIPSRGPPGASLVLRLHAHLDRRLALPSMTACTAHTPALSGGKQAPAFAPSAPVPCSAIILTPARPKSTPAVRVGLSCSLGNTIQRDVTVELYSRKPTLQRHKVPRNSLPQNSRVFHSGSAKPCEVSEELVGPQI
jgi:hypothetical protein